MTPASSLLLLVAILAAAAVPGGSAFLLPTQPQQSNHQRWILEDMIALVVYVGDRSPRPHRRVITPHRCFAGSTSKNEAAAAAVVSRVDVVKGAALSGLAAGLAAWGLPPAGVRAAEEGQTYTDDKYKASGISFTCLYVKLDSYESLGLEPLV